MQQEVLMGGEASWMKGDASLGWTAGAGEEAEPEETLNCMLRVYISGPACFLC